MIKQVEDIFFFKNKISDVLYLPIRENTVATLQFHSLMKFADSNIRITVFSYITDDKISSLITYNILTSRVLSMDQNSSWLVHQPVLLVSWLMPTSSLR